MKGKGPVPNGPRSRPISWCKRPGRTTNVAWTRKSFPPQIKPWNSWGVTPEHSRTNMNTVDQTTAQSPSPSSSSPTKKIRPLMEIVRRDGKCGVRWHLHRGQRRAMKSRKRFILVLAGWQSGKTEIGPPWLYREMIQKGPGDYLVASPTYPLMMKKVLPVFVRLFERWLRLGRFVAGKNIFTLSDEGCMRLWGHVPD